MFFGDVDAGFVSLIDNRLATVISPPGEVGLVSIRVRNPDDTAVVLEGAYRYFEPFEVTGITPSYDQLRGGTPFTLEGAGFPETVQVLFGNKQGILVERASSTSIVGVIPEGEAPGSVSVHLWTEAGFRTLEDGFTYLSSLEIESVDPWVVSTDGGELVRVTGKGFLDTTVVELGESRSPLCWRMVLWSSRPPVYLGLEHSRGEFG